MKVPFGKVKKKMSQIFFSLFFLPTQLAVKVFFSFFLFGCSPCQVKRLKNNSNSNSNNNSTTYQPANKLE
jgi:hypothetical protein